MPHHIIIDVGEVGKNFVGIILIMAINTNLFAIRYGGAAAFVRPTGLFDTMPAFCEYRQ